MRKTKMMAAALFIGLSISAGAGAADSSSAPPVYAPAPLFPPSGGSPPPPPGTPPMPPASAPSTPAPGAPSTPPAPQSAYTPQTPPPPPPGYVAPYPYYGRRRAYNPYSEPPSTSIWNFRVAGIGAFQSQTSVYSMFLSWNPQVTFRGGSYVSLNLGGTLLSNALNASFVALEYQAVFGHPIAGPLGMEIGVGGESWLSTYGETDPLLSVGLYYKLHAGIVDRIFVDYSADFVGYFYTSEAKAGLGFSF